MPSEAYDNVSFPDFVGRDYMRKVRGRRHCHGFQGRPGRNGKDWPAWQR